MKTTTVIALSALLLATACGQTKEDRAATGGLIGAGTGAIIGSTVGHPITGAAIGAGVGAAGGALIDPDKVNLGKPIWK